MSFGISKAKQVSSLRSEIRALSQTPEVIRRMSRFAGWKIAAGEEGFGYRLIQCSEDVQQPRDGYYVSNLVLQGGGTLGLAHVGLIVGLEEAGFRFPAVAGTSAGAIVTIGQFALRGTSILNPVGDRLTRLVEDMPMDTFVDGPRAIRRLIKRFAAKRSLMRLVYLPGAFMALRHVLRFRGLNSGQVFENWLASTLTEEHVDTIESLRGRAAQIANDLSAINHIEWASGDVSDGPAAAKANPFLGGKSQLDPDAMIKMIATAMPTGMKFCMPQDLHLLHHEYADISPAKMVRMSMSIPLFFEPCVLRTSKERWKAHVYREIAPFLSDKAAGEMADLQQLIFLDGGLFSNLPTDEAVKGMSPQIASISVPLVHDEASVSFQNRASIRALATDASVLANAVRLQRDRDAHSTLIRDQPDNRRVVKIDTGRANWLNFTMSKAEKEDLYVAGLVRVRDFLNKGY